ncbi:amidohydrolase family protein [Mycobacterium sp. Aquia_216]|uniref:amidohydrolase family protein n=1 Tax=Mycobacterium sp. Aquia_216 TaxID=2991729 RepID=UPI00227B4543|nr:amidohydrolase family protein [Mycobacterium sp. Aquia_216]WAJ44710.1 amidohydrolase family protein [Mycobacterium sp. Aquia_216]
MSEHRIVVRGGHLLTMDAALGTIPIGDVLVEDGEITAVAPSLPTVDAEVIDARGHIVAPGLIDTHRHTWQSQMRALCSDWTLGDYFFGIRLAVAPAYTAEDVYLGNRLGALEALNAGVTTILDFSHCNNSPDHSDAAVAGLQDAGIRGVFAYGFFDSSPQTPQFFADHGDRIKDFERIAARYFHGSDGLLSLGVALTEVGLIPLHRTRAEIQAARAHDALTVTHTGNIWSLPSGIAELDAAGLLSPDQVHVHCNALTELEWDILARHRAKISISPESELNMGMGRLAFRAAEQRGIKPTLSTDITSLNSGDLFVQLRLALAFKRWADAEPTNLAGADPRQVLTSAYQALEWTTINAAEALRLQDRIGSITVGKRADLIVIGGSAINQHPQIDPAGTLVFQTCSDDVRTVLVDGKVVKRDGVLQGVNLPDLTKRADVSAEAILDRVRATVPRLPGTAPAAFDELAELITANLRSAR